MNSTSVLGPTHYNISLRSPPFPNRSAMTSTAAMPEPPKGLVRTVLNSDRDMALQEYLALQEEHQYLRQHLTSLRESAGPGSPTSPHPTCSPTPAVYASSEYSSRSTSWSHSRGHHRSSSRTSGVPRPLSSLVPPSGLDTLIDESTIAEMAADEARLSDVNEGIKRALTELLNCETVRRDSLLRTWVQRRLMDTEKELRTGRRRRSAPDACIAA
ncbi:hypothetical protein DL546_008805 [Coniochaeta pulveracea]|uniref:Uncharacterized protein n=1 Tax=Coniochaeta pulveracea TaxID=177199 RepID=A0A420YNZ4_9PEZI|nr:hypothetical protein DL546_008805 [Coniochaeta pulveracea]